MALWATHVASELRLQDVFEDPMPIKPVHVVHVVYRFAAGGLENVIVQLVNQLPTSGFRHTIVALTTMDDVFSKRIHAPHVQFIALNKGPGQPYRLYPQVFRLLRQLKPDVFHSCNIAALEFAPVAAAAGVPLRIHAEHGWDVADPDGSNRKYQLLRRLYQKFVHRFVVVSEQLREYLLAKIGIAAIRVDLIPNGVDLHVFRPATPEDTAPTGFPFNRAEHWTIGTVGRLEPIKNQMLLARAVVRVLQKYPGALPHLRVAIVGAGPLYADIQQLLKQSGESHRLWMPGVRADIPEILRSLDCFVLPSLAEGTSCTLQEAMATGLPLIATNVGGNPALLQGGKIGTLVPSDDVEAMADAIHAHYAKPVVNEAGRNAILTAYDLRDVIHRYHTLFTKV